MSNSKNEEATDEEATDEEVTDEVAREEEATDEDSTDEESTDEDSTDEESTDEESTDEESTDEETTDEDCHILPLTGQNAFVYIGLHAQKVFISGWMVLHKWFAFQHSLYYNLKLKASMLTQEDMKIHDFDLSLLGSNLLRRSWDAFLQGIHRTSLNLNPLQPFLRTGKYCFILF